MSLIKAARIMTDLLNKVKNSFITTAAIIGMVFLLIVVLLVVTGIQSLWG